MTRAKIQAGGQLQLPQEILQAWSLQSNQEIDIRLVDNIVVLMPWSQKTEEDQDIMTYAGIGQGLWETPEAIDTHIRGTSRLMEQITTLLTRLADQSIYLDTNLFIYFFDKHPDYFSRVSPLFIACSKQITGVTSPLVMAEVMVKPYQNQNNELTHHIKNFFNQRHLFKFVTPTPETFDTASQLAAKHKIKLIDALHCAIAIQSGCKALITNDMGIPSLDSLEIILLKNLIQPY